MSWTTWWNSDWLYRKQIDLNTDGYTASNFPILVLLSDANIDMAKVRSDGNDIRFIDSSGTELSYELVTAWDDEGTNEVYVKVPTITGTDDYIWVYYGNASASAGENATDVWKNDDSLVEDGTGIADETPLTINSVSRYTLTVTQAGTFKVTLPTLTHGGVAESGTATLTDSPVDLVAGENIITVEDTGTITITCGGYAAVYHMNDNPDDSTEILDSTANANHGTKGAGAAAPTEVDGLFGKAQSFDNDNATIISISTITVDVDSGTVEVFVKRTADSAESAQYMLGHTSSYYNGWHIQMSDQRPRMEGGVNGDYWGAVLPANTLNSYYYYATTASSGITTGYENGSYDSDRESTSDMLLSKIGSESRTNRGFTGLISSVRISSVARNADWIALTDATLSDYATFNTFGEEETFISPQIISSTASIGSHQINLSVLANLIASEASIGSHQINHTVLAQAITSGLVVGDHIVIPRRTLNKTVNLPDRDITVTLPNRNIEVQLK